MGCTFLSWLTIAGIPLAVFSAVYTAYLFAQAKARDMWQNPLLPPHLLVQSLLLGAATLLPFGAWLEPELEFPLLWVLAVTSLLHLLMIWGEVSLTHPTWRTRVWLSGEMVQGRYRSDFWMGIGLSVAAGLLVSLAIAGSLSSVVCSRRGAVGPDGNDALRTCLRSGGGSRYPLA